MGGVEGVRGNRKEGVGKDGCGSRGTGGGGGRGRRTQRKFVFEKGNETSREETIAEVRAVALGENE